MSDELLKEKAAAYDRLMRLLGPAMTKAKSATPGVWWTERRAAALGIYAESKTGGKNHVCSRSFNSKRPPGDDFDFIAAARNFFILLECADLPAMPPRRSEGLLKDDAE